MRARSVPVTPYSDDGAAVFTCVLRMGCVPTHAVAREASPGRLERLGNAFGTPGQETGDVRCVSGRGWLLHEFGGFDAECFGELTDRGQAKRLPCLAPLHAGRVHASTRSEFILADCTNNTPVAEGRHMRRGCARRHRRREGTGRCIWRALDRQRGHSIRSSASQQFVRR